MRLIAAVFFIASCAQAQTARELAALGLKALGGQERLQAISSLRFKAIGHRSMVEQSIRPEGPYVIEYDEIDELHDFGGNRFRRKADFRVAMQPAFHETVAFADGVALQDRTGQFMAGSQSLADEAQAGLELSPERVLLTALASTSLRRDSDAVVHAAPHNVLTFVWRDAPVRLLLDADSHLLCILETASPRLKSSYWRYAAGDVQTRVEFSNWLLDPSGILYPLQWDIVRNGLPDRVLSINDLKLNEPVDDKLFPLTDQLRAQFKARQTASIETLPLQAKQAVEAAPGILFIPGPWNVTLIRQQEGIVVLEAPISSGYSAAVLAEAKSRFPNLPVKAVITTSDSWPHLAGIREYVANGIPVYALDRNAPILKRWIATPRSTRPDSLEKHKQDARWTFVSAKTSLGEGPNRLEIYPLHTATGERQMMVYFPGHRLLYGSDLFQVNGDQYYTPQSVSELLTAVQRERLEVETYFMMHVAPTPWNQLTSAKLRNPPPTE